MYSLDLSDESGTIREKYLVKGEVFQGVVGRVKDIQRDDFLDRRSNFRGVTLRWIFFKKWVGCNHLNIWVNHRTAVAEQSPFLMLDPSALKGDVSLTETGDEIIDMDNKDAKGMFKDIALELTKTLNWTLSLFARKDGVWGGLDREHGNYTGMIGSLYKGEADLVATSLTVTSERAGV